MQVLSPHRVLIIPLQLLSQLQILVYEIFVIFLHKIYKGNVILLLPFACMFALAEDLFLCVPLFSTLICLIQNVLSCWLLLVPGGTKHKFGLIETSRGYVRSLEGSRLTILCVLEPILPILPSSYIILIQSRKQNLYT